MGVALYEGNITDYYTNPVGEVYYVRDDGDDGNSGKTPAQAFETLKFAVSVAGNWDKIIVFPSTDCSTYLEVNPIAITQIGLKIFGAQPTRYMWGSPAIHTHAATTLMTIDANMVEIAFLSFHHQGAGISLQIGQTGVAWRAYIHDCHFGGNNEATYGIDMGGTMDAPFTVVERCYFQGYAEAGIRSYAYYSTIKDCDFEVYDSKYGILHTADTGNRPGTRIIDNRFSTTDSTSAVGIQVSNTPTAGMLFVDGNHFANFNSDAHCISTVAGYTGLNWFGSTVIAVS